jgi:flavin reductase (DIM6/NTAB) family NADH-FMN oxidoreductase RutF
MKLEKSKFYKILAPRPVILVSTISPKGIANAAPFSFVMPVSIEPPLIAFASDPAHDTVKNILKTGEFVVNIPGRNILKKVWICRESFPYGVSEIEKAGLSEEKSSRVRPPRIKECIAHFECRLFKKQKAGDHLLIVGKVLEARANDRFFKKGKYQLRKAVPLMHIGSEEFGLLGRVIKAE